MKNQNSVFKKLSLVVFAALGAVSAWCDDGWVGSLPSTLSYELKEISLSVADGVIKVKDSYKNYSSTAMDVETSIRWKFDGDAEYSDKTVTTSNSGITQTSDPSWRGTEHEQEGGYFKLSIPGFEEGATILAEYTVRTVQSSVTNVSSKVFTFMTSGVLTSVGNGWENNPKQYLISGTYVGDGISKIIVQYELLAEYNSDTYTSCVTDASATIEATMNEYGTYECKVPFDDDDLQLVWRVYTQRESTSDEEGEKILFTDGSGESVFYTQRREGGNVAYIWTGNGGDNRWANAQNWEVVANDDGKKESLYGYPGVPCGWSGNYESKVTITNSCEIDLEGGSYGLGSGGATLVFAEGINVKLKNGTLGLSAFSLPDVGGKSSYTLGAKGTVVEYDNLALPYHLQNTTERYNMGFAEGSTNIFTGTQNFYWNHRPWYKDTLTVFRDGEIKCYYSNSAQTGDSNKGLFDNLDSQTVLITNAVWTIKRVNTITNFNHGIAGRVEFRNGERQAQLLCGDLDDINMSGLLMMHGTYDIELPRKAYGSSYVIAKHLYNTTGFDLAFDVTDCPYAMKAPILTFAMLDEAGCTSNVMTSITNSQSFTVYAAGRSNNDKTKRERNARLEWDESTRTLYYVQDSPVKGMRVIVR